MSYPLCATKLVKGESGWVDTMEDPAIAVSVNACWVHLQIGNIKYELWVDEAQELAHYLYRAAEESIRMTEKRVNNEL